MQRRFLHRKLARAILALIASDAGWDDVLEKRQDKLVLQPEFSVNFGMRRESQDDPRRCKALGDGARGGCGVDCAALWAGGATASGAGVFAWIAVGSGAQERLAVGRASRRPYARRDAGLFVPSALGGRAGAR